MSRLDYEFEHLLVFWLDHCAESLLALPPAAQLDDAVFFDAARANIERFRSMIADCMEKLREMFHVLLFRARTKTPTALLASSSSSASSVAAGEEHLVFDVARAELEQAGMLHGDDASASKAASVSPAFAKVQAVRQAQFMWTLFDCFIQAVPLVAVTWCCAASNVSGSSAAARSQQQQQQQSLSFVQLVQRSLPWEYVCSWCDTLVSSRWEPLFRSVDRRVAADLAKLARDKRTAILNAQNMAAERRARRLEDEASAATRAASAKEMAELQELAQRLVAALQRHKPSDGRSVNVKLEAGTLVKQEAAARLQAGAAQLSAFGNTVDTALDVDEEYEPTFVEGAQMDAFANVKMEAAATTTTTDGGGAAAAAGGGVRREARKRPR